MIRAVVFDLFGVLAYDGWSPFRQKYFASNPDLKRQADQLNKLKDAGQISYEAFLDKIALLAGVSLAELDRAINSNKINAELIDFIKSDLKPNYKVGVLSNSGGNWLETMFSPAQLEAFDSVALSFEIGAVKPEPEAFKIITARLDVLPSECLFIDDKLRYCQAAEAVGLKAIQYENLEQTKTDILARLKTG